MAPNMGGHQQANEDEHDRPAGRPYLGKAPQGRSRQPSGKTMLSAKIMKFLLYTLPPRHAVGQARHNTPRGQAASRARGEGPGRTVSPPRCPGPHPASSAGGNATDVSRPSANIRRAGQGGATSQSLPGNSIHSVGMSEPFTCNTVHAQKARRNIYSLQSPFSSLR
jgi:hypothetical protein